MRGRWRTGAVAVVLAGAVGGCYGSTEPATDVRPNGALLNARGTADNGPAYAFFRFWPTADPSRVSQTFEREIPAGASGPFSAEARRLPQATPYTFQLCGRDQSASAEQTVCAQTRTFTTGVGDVLEALYGQEPRVGGNCSIEATSGPSGENPGGSVGCQFGIQGSNFFRGRVSCLAVSGTRAAVGAVGRIISASGSDLRSGSVLLTVEGRSATQLSRASSPVERPSSPPPDCANASYADLRGQIDLGFRLEDVP